MKILYLVIFGVLALLPGETGTVSPINNPLADQLVSGMHMLTNYNGSFNVNISYAKAFSVGTSVACFPGLKSFQQTMSSNGQIYAFLTDSSCQLTYLTISIDSMSLLITRIKSIYLAVNINAFNSPSLNIFKFGFCCYFFISSTLSKTVSLLTAHPVDNSGGFIIGYFLFVIDIQSTSYDYSLKIAAVNNGTHLSSITLSSYSPVMLKINSVTYTIVYFGLAPTQVSGQQSVWIDHYQYIQSSSFLHADYKLYYGNRWFDTSTDSHYLYSLTSYTVVASFFEFNIDQLTRILQISSTNNNLRIQVYSLAIPKKICPAAYPYYIELQYLCTNSCPISNELPGYLCSCPADCDACSSPTVCSTCSIGFYLGINNLCYSCPSNCDFCSFSTVCTICSSGFYLRNDNNCYTSCLAGTFLDSSNTKCQDCSISCSTCSNLTHCLTCSPSYFMRADNLCYTTCLAGYYPESSNRTCVFCPIGCSTCLNLTHCLTCSLNYFLGAENLCYSSCPDGSYTQVNNFTCLRCPADCSLCISGIKINGICHIIEGCQTYRILLNKTVLCSFCDIFKHFKSLPNQNGECVCLQKYKLKSSACLEICGDGFLMNSQTNKCDDGNSLNGDGCSDDCLVQEFYKCQNGSSTRSSNCYYWGNLTLTLESIQRTEGKNQGKMKFAISPPLQALNAMNFQQNIVLICNSNYFISSLNYEKGILSISVDYAENFQGCDCNITLSYDKTLIRSYNSTLTFKVTSKDIPLTFSEKLNMFETFQFIYYVLSLIALALFVLSLGHKLMGAQLLTSCQMVYLSNCFYTTPSFLYDSVKSFGLVTGGWPLFFDQEQKKTLFPFTYRIELSSSFFEGSKISGGILLVSFVIWIIVIAVLIMVKKSEKTSQRTINSCQALNFLGIFSKSIYRLLIFPVLASLLIMFSLSGYMSNRRFSQSIKTSMQINSIFMLAVWLIQGVVLLIYFFPNKTYRQLKGEKGVQQWYIISFIFRSLLFGLLFQMSISLSMSSILYFILIIQLVYFTIFLCKNPYYSLANAISAISCQIPIIYSLLLAVVRQFYIVPEMYELFLILVLQGLIIVVMLIFCFRLVRFYKKLICHYLLKQNRLNQAVNQSINKVPKVQKRQFQEELQQSILKLKQQQPFLKHRRIKQVGLNNSINDQIDSKRKMKIQIENEESRELKEIKERLRKQLVSKER